MENHQVVYAISDNIISSLGVNTQENLRQIYAEQSGITRIEDSQLYVEPVMASRLNWERVSSMPGYAAHDTYSRLERVMIASATDALSKTDIQPDELDTIFIFSTTKGNVDVLAKNNGTVPTDAYLYTTAQRVADHFNAANPPIVVSNACISGVVAPILAEHMLRTGKYTNAIIIGGDLLTEFVISGFESFKSVSISLCRPYDQNHDGLNLGEGVATLIVSTDASKVKDKKPIMLAGGSTSNDANHISGPSRTGEELKMAIESALAEAGLTADDIDMADAHGTATVYNDEMEAKAINLSGLGSKPLISLKSYFGHTLGASGLIETIVCIEALRQQMIPRTLGFENAGDTMHVNVSTQTSPATLRNIVKTASGFGGCNAALVLSTTNGGQSFRNYAEIDVIRKCNIDHQQVKIDGNVCFDGSQLPDYATFIRAAFKQESESYLKFGKMDDLCKLALVCCEYLLKNIDLSAYNSRDISLLLTCKSSSLDTDLQHQAIINNKNPYQPSPAVFVYTLANVMQGEICIRHRIKGECLCLVDNSLSDNRLTEYASIMFAQERAQICIAGYVDYLQGNYKAQLSLMQPRQRI